MGGRNRRAGRPAPIPASRSRRRKVVSPNDSPVVCPDIGAPPGAPIILDLCAGSGSWSLPYLEAGYDVRHVDIDNDLDVRALAFPGRVRGVLAAPPCTDLARSGAQYWKAKGPEALLHAVSVADACIRVAVMSEAMWWALENPEGRLRRILGPPAHTFTPSDYGDPWEKRTLLWGSFRIPARRHIARDRADLSKWLQNYPQSRGRARMRSCTPPGFARAFFKANP